MDPHMEVVLNGLMERVRNAWNAFSAALLDLVHYYRRASPVLRQRLQRRVVGLVMRINVGLGYLGALLNELW